MIIKFLWHLTSDGFLRNEYSSSKFTWTCFGSSNRSSLWRCKEFDHLEPPKNWNDMELFCGGRLQQYEVNDGKCGVCGDPFDEPVLVPMRMVRDNCESLSKWCVIPVEVELTTSHKGWFEFKLCSKEDTASHLDQACFDEHPLELADGSGTKYKVPIEGGYYYAEYNLTLPKEVTCEHCVIQWHYETGNSWGNCTDGFGALGCGQHENFRGCSDVTILPENTKHLERNPNSRFGPGEDEFGEIIPMTYHNAKRRCNRTTGGWEEAKTESVISDSDFCEMEIFRPPLLSQELGLERNVHEPAIHTARI
ncbi:hypothetical protein Ocin01_12109 [Orchesella cincta]|uniref:Chitin-binding type-4 domain-containing protein n=1 Tax=Orchesella cincta TaxID=48709 RepID=A0A1D2MNA7_ORCCI|nr:hypothetical protein Ocin01_12109 [Orchesella cincta]